MNNIYLIGFMGTGKSAVSRALEQITDRTVIDTDQYIEAQEARKIKDIFEQDGEACFRQLETKVLEQIGKENNQIISCGGGIVLQDENIELMKSNGVVVLLCATPQTVYERVRYSKNRPLLKGNMNVQFIKKLMQEREARYLKAQMITIQTDGKYPLDIAQEILEKADTIS